MNLDVTNFFKYFIIHPDSDLLDKKDHSTALISSLVLGIMSLGLIHLLCALAFHDYKPFPPGTETRETALFQETLGGSPTARASTVKGSSQIRNTPLTEVLAQYTFGTKEHYDKNIKDLNTRLQELAVKAKTGDLQAESALRTPNNEGEIFTPELVANGMPQNTPLALLVKMGNTEGCKILLPAYDAEALMFKNPRGNTVLHLAIVTGQMEVALAIMARADELHRLDDLLGVENNIGKNADIMLASILKLNRDEGFKPFLDLADSCFGGEEINKALIYARDPKPLLPFQVRSNMVKEIKGGSFKEIQQMNLAQIYAQYGHS